jgi:hypothetical protein
MLISLPGLAFSMLQYRSLLGKSLKSCLIAGMLRLDEIKQKTPKHKARQNILLENSTAKLLLQFLFHNVSASFFFVPKLRRIQADGSGTSKRCAALRRQAALDSFVSLCCKRWVPESPLA